MYKINGNNLPIFDNDSDMASDVVELKSIIENGKQLSLSGVLDDCIIHDTDSSIQYIVVNELEKDDSKVFVGVDSNYSIDVIMKTPRELEFTEEFLSELEEHEIAYYNDLIKGSPDIHFIIYVSSMTHHLVSENYGQLAKNEGTVGVDDTSLQAINIDIDMNCRVNDVRLNFSNFEEFNDILRIVKNQLQLGLIKKLPITLEKSVMTGVAYRNEQMRDITDRYTGMRKSIKASFDKGGSLSGYAKTRQVTKEGYDRIRK